MLHDHETQIVHSFKFCRSISKYMLCLFYKEMFRSRNFENGCKTTFLMSPVLKSVFFINRVRVLCRQVRLFSKVSPSVESGFFSSPRFVRVRVRVRVGVRSGFRSMPSCPSHCTCSVIHSVLNCANGGFRRIPHGMTSRYKKLNLAYNRIRNLSLEDIRRLDTFKSVDLTHNPLNCIDLYFVLRNRTFISTDCDYRILEHILTTYTQTKPTTGRLNTTEYTTPNERARNGRKPIFMIF